MSNLYPVSGCRIYIGPAMDLQSRDFVLADFESVSPPLSWVEIDGWSTMGAVGDAAQVITTSLINRGRDVKQKGTANAGSMENVFAIIPGDAGQAALLAAAAASNKRNYAFRIDLNDGDDTVSPVVAPSRRYFVALATMASEAGGDANTIQNLNVTLEINSNIVKKAAA